MFPHNNILIVTTEIQMAENQCLPFTACVRLC